MLFVQDERAGLKFICTATAFEKTSTGYLFVTAGHCTEDGDKDTAYFVSLDPAAKDRPYIPASLYMQGHDDLAVLKVDTTEEIPTVALGDQKTLHAGSQIFNVASPQGLGKLLFFGYVSALEQARHTRDGAEHPYLLMQMPAAPGSSGSAIFDNESGKIVGILIAVYVSKFGGPVVTAATPVSCVTEELKQFRERELLFGTRGVDLFHLFSKK